MYGRTALLRRRARYMKRHLEFHFDVVCPFAYFAATQVEALCKRVNASLSWHPFLLGGVFQVLGSDQNPAASMNPHKAKHNLLDAVRWADLLGVPFQWHRRHPVRTLIPMRVLTALSDASGKLTDPGAALALYRAYWAQGLN